MFQLWTVSKLGKLPWSILKDVRFYAPLTESLDFFGVDPVSFTRAGGATRTGRDGLVHQIETNVPPFNFSGDTPSGLWWIPTQALSYSPANSLNDGNTLIWFENAVPKSTPTDPNIFDGSGNFGGIASRYYKHVLKMNRLATDAEIIEIQLALGDIAQEMIPPVTRAPEAEVGAFYKEVPAGVVNGVNTVFTLSFSPNPASVIVAAHGVFCEGVAANPGNMQYVLSGADNKTLTMGLAPQTGFSFWISYVVA